jgi:hypothetical protein
MQTPVCPRVCAVALQMRDRRIVTNSRKPDQSKSNLDWSLAPPEGRCPRGLHEGDSRTSGGPCPSHPLIRQRGVQARKWGQGQNRDGRRVLQREVTGPRWKSGLLDCLSGT